MRNIRRFAALIAILFSALLCQCAEKKSETGIIDALHGHHPLLCMDYGLP